MNQKADPIKQAATMRVRKTFAPGPHKAGYIDAKRSVRLKGRQFGPGPNAGSGGGSRLVKNY